MKVSIITILDNTNYGTYLQALAIAKAIESLGHTAEVIRYIRPIMTAEGHSKMLLRERGFLRWLSRRRYIPVMLKLRELDYRYIGKFIKVTQEYCSFDQLKKNPPIADVYLTGSDQVWNSIYNRGVDLSYYLEFAPTNAKKISYAASIGMEKFSDSEVGHIHSLLSKYNAITVREKSAQTLLSDLGISSEVVLDPTLLLDNVQWSDIAAQYTLSLEEPYLLVYSVETKTQNKLIEHYAKEIASKYRYKIYQVSYSKGRGFTWADKAFTKATPDIFLNLMKNASFVIASSFHGTAFAINFNKPFFSIAANRFNSRVENLLDITHLKDRLITDSRSCIEDIKDIDYQVVNSLLKTEREKSLHILKSMIEK